MNLAESAAYANSYVAESGVLWDGLGMEWTARREHLSPEQAERYFVQAAMAITGLSAVEWAALPATERGVRVAQMRERASRSSASQ